MKITPAFALIALVCLFAATPALRAQKAPPDLYAQVLVDWVMANHPELEHCTIHAVYPGRQIYTSGLVGVDHKGAQAGDDDDGEDYVALTTGKDNFYHYEKHNKNLWKVVMPLWDRKCVVIGELTLRQQYTTKEDEAKITKSFKIIRNQLKVLIPSQKSLFETGKAVKKTYAQSLIDSVVATHPGIERLTIHAFAPGAAALASCNVACTVPEAIGLEDDPEDYVVMTTGKPNYYRYTTQDKKDTFKGLILINDVQGRQLGMLVARLPYTTKEDEPKQQEKIEAIRNWLQLHIPSKKALYEPVAE